MVSAASSGISIPNSSSNAMTSSTVSRLSAPRSSMKLASGVTFSASTPRCSTTIFLTRSATSLIVQSPLFCPFSGGNHCVTPVASPRAFSLQIFRSARITPTGFGGLLSHFPAAEKEPAERCAGPFPPSHHEHAAIHMEGLAGDVGSLAAGEERHRGGNFLRISEPPHRYGGEDGGTALAVEDGGHRRFDEAGS